MNRNPISYSQLNSRAQENYNFAKLSGVLADYGYVCLRLSDDWNGDDILALGQDGDTLRIQLKGRLTIDSIYQGQGICMAFPFRGSWYVVEHDVLRDLVIATTPNSVVEKRYRAGEPYSRHAGRPSTRLIDAIEPYKL